MKFWSLGATAIARQKREARMHLGILQTGRIPETMTERYDEYPEVFADMYRSADPDIRVSAYAVLDQQLPDAPDVCDAWLITGSKFGVYDDEPWIEPLKDFLRAARAVRIPMIGICFGHQIMAEAFGGRAEKFSDGWACGVHDYDVVQQPGWMGPDLPAFSMHAMHQDQVTALPYDATLLATSEFCRNAMLTYGDPEAPDAISIQPHPEFAVDFARELVEVRAGELIPLERSGPALESFGRPVDGAAFVEWSLAYLRQTLAGREAA
ncbi:MAG: hypothetical protein AAF557_26150 [Pseudomonadota bacterium]